jgi:3-deoxy-D-arabino-heptulosonate 7-phosphate (DAHP) synthase class II
MALRTTSSLKKKTHKNIVESVKGFMFSLNAKGKKVGGVHAMLQSLL